MENQMRNNTIILQNVLETINNLPSISNIAPENICSGTFGGAVVAQRNSQTYSSYLLRNSTLTTSATNPSYNGEICWTYE